MGRTSTVWQRKRDGFWMTTINGQQVKLSRDKKDADKMFHALLAAPPEKEERGGAVPSFKKLADLFLAYTAANCVPKVLVHRRYYLQLFCDQIGKKLATELKPHMVSTFIDAHEWSESTRVTARSAVVGCLRWGVKQGYISRDPLVTVKVGNTERRRRVLTQDERDRIRAACKGSFLDFLTACELTGGRPFSEVAKITAGMIDWEEGVIRFAVHKNAKRGKTRTVYLTPPLEELLKRKVAEHPTGLLFRSGQGGAWQSTAVCYYMRKMETELKLPRLNFAAYRKAAITDALEKGISAEVVSELMGNTPQTIHNYYSQLSERRKLLKAAAAKAVS